MLSSAIGRLKAIVRSKKYSFDDHMSLFSNSRLTQHVLFWLSVFIYFFITANMVFFQDYVHLTISTLSIMIPQIITAYVLLYLLIPRYLNTNKYGLFILSLLLMLTVLFWGYILFRINYFDIYYLHTYNEVAKAYTKMSTIERLFDLKPFFSKTVKFLTPAALLYTYKLYKDQQLMLQLSEQKKAAELTALKNQLNPHFLFNTLNNLYVLALERSEKTPEVIERLSDILDYILYQCKDNLVPIEKEIALIENYLALEKVRYSKRVNISFAHNVENPAQVAPLIFLTFIENAFKHGVGQELGVAKIEINIDAKPDHLIFKIENTKPNYTNHETKDDKCLGLKNATQQLDLIYAQSYNLNIMNSSESFKVQLKLPVRDV